jgi:hypothetical protein
MFVLSNQNPTTLFAKSLIEDDNIQITTELIECHKHDFFLRKALQDVCLKHEILCNYSNEFVISNWFPPSMWTADIENMRKSYQSIKDCPSLDETATLPTLKEVQAILKHNRDVECYLSRLCTTSYSDIAFKALKDNEQLEMFWRQMKDAVEERYSIKDRRIALKNVKEWLGEEDFRNRKLPPSVPIWYFSEIP